MKNKKMLIGIIIVVLIGIILCVCNVLKNEEKNKIDDGLKFSEEYPSISSNNVFVYRSADEIIKIMENGTGVVYLGFPECKWCQAYVKYLDEVANEVGIEKIYYYNILDDRTNNTKEYERIVELLGDSLQYNDEGNKRIFVPNVSFHIDGKLIGNDYETSKDTNGFANPEDYWTKEEVDELKNVLIKYMQRVDEANRSCTDCNK